MSFNNSVKSEIENHLRRGTQEQELAVLFLSCGFISDPQKEYRLEFHTAKHTPTQQLLKTLAGRDIVAHSVMRHGRFVVYITASEQIEDLLTMMGAQNSALEMMNVKIEKDIHNNSNRIANCEIANAERIAKTNAILHRAVELLKENGVTLPDQLIEAAELVYNYPEMSMSEMAKELNLSKSGLYHRMQKLKTLAEQYK